MPIPIEGVGGEGDSGAQNSMAGSQTNMTKGKSLVSINHVNDRLCIIDFVDTITNLKYIA